MGYYRRAAAVFIVIISLISPLILEKEGEVAVVELETLVEKSTYLNSIVKKKLQNENKTKNNKIKNNEFENNKIENNKNEEKREKEIERVTNDNKAQKAVKKEIMALIKSSAAEYAAENNYSSVITKDPLYKGGTDITEALAQKLDSSY